MNPDIEVLATRLREHAGGQGFNAFLGVQLDHIAEGEIDLSVTIRQNLTQHHGFVHGGIVGAIADTACAWAAATVLGDVLTAGYTLQLLAPAQGAVLRAKARVQAATPRQAAVQGVVTCEAPGIEATQTAIMLATVRASGRRISSTSE